MYRPMEGGNYSVVSGAQEHEVFLNFRGKDCRKSLTDHLYQGLIRAGVRVFRDNEKLHIGEEISDELIRGIKESTIYIPIFSKNYAESKWCLREFALMMECRKELKRTVLPIFYDVSPDDVQHQKPDTYVKAFAEHGSKVGAETVYKWKDALTQVGSFKGWNLRDEFNGHEGELVNAVVAEVKKRLKKDHIHTQGKFVGLDDKIKQVMQLRDVDVRIIGIWGMGGIGKTTLANAVYNKLLDQFDCCGFLESVRAEASTSGGLRTLLEILIRKLSRSERQHIDTVSEGRKQLSERFREKKVLIFIDDVDRKEHLEALALADDGKDSWFAKGSLVIVTTRDSMFQIQCYPIQFRLLESFIMQRGRKQQPTAAEESATPPASATAACVRHRRLPSATACRPPPPQLPDRPVQQPPRSSSQQQQRSPPPPPASVTAGRPPQLPDRPPTYRFDPEKATSLAFFILNELLKLGENGW